MEIAVLGSGSTGNATVVRSAGTTVLIEAGLSARQIATRARDAGFAPEKIAAAFVSHAHGDHVAGAPVFSRRFRVPVYMTDAAYDAWDRGAARSGAARRSAATGVRRPADAQMHHRVRLGESETVDLGALRVQAFPVPHDGAGTVGFVIESAGLRFGYVTDLGHVTTLVIERLRGCDAVLVEMNHDTDMLRDGPYPWDIKQRIASRHGHLSNEQGASLVEQILGADTRSVLLGHLSETNNDPTRALVLARLAVERAGRGDVTVRAAEPHRPTEVVEL